MVTYLYKFLRNKKVETASEFQVFDDAGAAVEQKASVSDAGGLLTKGKVASGP